MTLAEGVERYAGRETGNFICVFRCDHKKFKSGPIPEAAYGKKGKGEVEFIFDELTDQVDKKEPSHYIEEQELVACINHFLKNLPKEHRVMFVRRYWYFDSITEIAERCACSEAKVKTTLFRVRGKLLDYLKKEGYAL